MRHEVRRSWGDKVHGETDLGVVPAPSKCLGCSFLTCLVISGMSGAGLRKGNRGDVGGSSRAAGGEARWAEAGQHAVTRRADG